MRRDGGVAVMAEWGGEGREVSLPVLTVGSLFLAPPLGAGQPLSASLTAGSAVRQKKKKRKSLPR